MSANFSLLTSSFFIEQNFKNETGYGTGCAIEIKDSTFLNASISIAT